MSRTRPRKHQQNARNNYNEQATTKILPENVKKIRRTPPKHQYQNTNRKHQHHAHHKTPDQTSSTKRRAQCFTFPLDSYQSENIAILFGSRGHHEMEGRQCYFFLPFPQVKFTCIGNQTSVTRKSAHRGKRSAVWHHSTTTRKLLPKTPQPESSSAKIAPAEKNHHEPSLTINKH